MSPFLHFLSFCVVTRWLHRNPIQAFHAARQKIQLELIKFSTAPLLQATRKAFNIMVTHWESSRRPLYIRTVWRDGQHHVILDKTKEHSDVDDPKRKPKQLLPNQVRATKSAGPSVNLLNVSSVRVLLSGVRRHRNGSREIHLSDKPPERPKTWTSGSICSRQIACKNLNNEVDFGAIKGFRPPSLHPSHYAELPSLEAECANNDPQMKPTSKKSLMMTADTEIKQVSEEGNNMVDYSVLKTQSPSGSHKDSSQNILIYSNQEISTVTDENFYHILPLRANQDDDECQEELEKEVDPRMNSVRRQLHIFMPNLPAKRSSDCNSSIISSKISSQL
ncbi:uncharacterized protein [Euwallacea fornicatus]|uniref:uncharacterized protein isoform X2 n=1 Tax=Euwallacea fornicatus TaxID=995702 RepID=UPI00338DDBC7